MVDVSVNSMHQNLSHDTLFPKHIFADLIQQRHARC